MNVPKALISAYFPIFSACRLCQLSNLHFSFDVFSACRIQNIPVMLLDRFHRLYHVSCFPMPMIIFCLPAVLMVDHNRLICAILIFADNPAVPCVLGKELNIPLRFPYDGEVPLPDYPFLFLCEHRFSFE